MTPFSLLSAADLRWQTVPGLLLSNHSVQGYSFPQTNRYDIFAVDKQDVLYQKTFTGSSWTSAWIKHFGPFLSAPAVVGSKINHVDVFGLNADHNLVHQAWDGVKWSPSLTSGENLGGWLQNFE